MMTSQFFHMVYFVVNVVCFLMYGVDKAKAIYNQWRIKESTLLGFSVFGPFGAIIAMILFWHKVRKIKFIAFNIFMIIGHIMMYFIWVIRY